MAHNVYGHTTAAPHDGGYTNPPPPCTDIDRITTMNDVDFDVEGYSRLDDTLTVFAGVATDLILGGHSHSIRRFNCTDIGVAMHLHDIKRTWSIMLIWAP